MHRLLFVIEKGNEKIDLSQSKNVSSSLPKGHPKKHFDYKISHGLFYESLYKQSKSELKQNDNENEKCLLKQFVINMAKVLDALQSCNVVHGDIKPQNVVMDMNGES